MARQRLWWLGALIFVGLGILISSNSAQWVFLARVQWVALLGLTILPLLAHTSGRELLIGAYDLNSKRAGFQVGLLLILVATSIIDTAYIVELQTAKRELLKNFELPDDSGSHRNAMQGPRVVKNSRSLTLNSGAISDSTRCCMDERQGRGLIA